MGMRQNDDAPILQIKCDPEKIEWKPGQDVTVEKIAKKVKGGGAKKAKQKKEKEEPRPSFFRLFFRTLKKDDELPKDLCEMMKGGMMMDDGEESDMDEEPETEDYFGCLGQTAWEIMDSVVPHAVRWYTGEAAPSDDEDMGEDDEEEDDDLGDEDDSDDEPSP